MTGLVALTTDEGNEDLALPFWFLPSLLCLPDLMKK